MLAIFKFLGILLLGVGMMVLLASPSVAIILILIFGLGSFALSLMAD